MAAYFNAPTRPAVSLSPPPSRFVDEQAITRALESTARIVAGVAGLFGLPVAAVPPTRTLASSNTAFAMLPASTSQFGRST
ncbi:MAG: hypothetical protein NVS3B21_16590 [Acidimicrobiales bacterium]